jgi:hypothetical protein
LYRDEREQIKRERDVNKERRTNALLEKRLLDEEYDQLKARERNNKYAAQLEKDRHALLVARDRLQHEELQECNQKLDFYGPPGALQRPLQQPSQWHQQPPLVGHDGYVSRQPPMPLPRPMDESRYEHHHQQQHQRRASPPPSHQRQPNVKNDRNKQKPQQQQQQQQQKTKSGAVSSGPCDLYAPQMRPSKQPSKARGVGAVETRPSQANGDGGGSSSSNKNKRKHQDVFIDDDAAEDTVPRLEIKMPRKRNVVDTTSVATRKVVYDPAKRNNMKIQATTIDSPVRDARKSPSRSRSPPPARRSRSPSRGRSPSSVRSYSSSPERSSSLPLL